MILGLIPLLNSNTYNSGRQYIREGCPQTTVSSDKTIKTNNKVPFSRYYRPVAIATAVDYSLVYKQQAQLENATVTHRTCSSNSTWKTLLEAASPQISSHGSVQEKMPLPLKKC